MDSNLDFAGKTLYTVTKHKRLNTDTELLTKDEFTYTNQDRLLTQTHQINALPKQLIVSNAYDELGKLISKKVGGNDTTGAIGLQKVDYKYNIRGWLTYINDTNNLTNGTDPQDLFAFKINYNTPSVATALFNGNIAETFWKTKSDNSLRKYEYNYDNLNRLLSAVYQKPEGTLTNNNSYNESLNYDKNGNITDLVRYGGFETDGSYPTVLIDQLSYSYKPNSNQLQSVYDSSVNPEGFNDRNLTLTDYDYDANGNMNLDNNKQIQSITYNHLNLPTKITFATTGTIEYLYNAIGQKVSKKVFDTGTNLTTITDYLSNYQYKNNVLQFFSTAEGYVNFTASLQKGGTDSYNYVFNYTDHLGNIRLSYSQDPSNNVLKIIEENHYYPFGLKHSGYNAEQLVYAKNSSDVLRLRPVPPLFVTSYNIKFQNQKREEELGLNWDSFKWRNYDYAIGRFMSIDPLSEKYVYNGTYNFAENRVIDGRELEGLEWVVSHKDKNLIYDISANNGKGDFTKYATNDDRNLAKSLNQTDAGRTQFNSLVNSDVPTTTKIDTKNTPTDADTGGLILGLTDPIIAKSGNIKQDKDENGKVVGLRPEGFEITIFQKNVDSAIKGITTGKGGDIYGKDVPKGSMNFSQLMGVIFGHEIAHATTADLLNGQKNPANAEGPATKVSDKIIDQTIKK